jgi:hypothetical protein
MIRNAILDLQEEHFIKLTAGISWRPLSFVHFGAFINHLEDACCRIKPYLRFSSGQTSPALGSSFRSLILAGAGLVALFSMLEHPEERVA